MWKSVSVFISALLVTTLPSSAELLQVDLSIFGMD
jgi:hypothetical protein